LRKSFTIVEMVVVITIIGILASIIFVFAQESRAKSRDSRRVHDLQQIQGYLEGIKLSTGKYPVSGAASATTDPDRSSFWSYSCTENSETDTIYYSNGVCRGDSLNWILNNNSVELPKDPMNIQRTKCTVYSDADNICYFYEYGSDGYNYKLVSRMETSYGEELGSKDNGSSPTTCSASFTSANGTPKYNCGPTANLVCENNKTIISTDPGNGKKYFDGQAVYELYSPGFRCL